VIVTSVLREMFKVEMFNTSIRNLCIIHNITTDEDIIKPICNVYVMDDEKLPGYNNTGFGLLFR